LVLVLELAIVVESWGWGWGWGSGIRFGAKTNLVNSKKSIDTTIRTGSSFRCYSKDQQWT
jgi:hypothetical protein